MIHITELTKTCFACPAQWEGRTADGDYVYIRYRLGYLTLDIGKTLRAAVAGDGALIGMDHGGDRDGFMDEDELIELLRGRVLFTGHALERHTGTVDSNPTGSP